MLAQAFVSTEGVELVRSARSVRAAGGAVDWREATGKRARRVLRQWKADLAVVGLVKQPGMALSLWFVPAAGGEGTLRRGDRPYSLVNATLGPDFHDDLRVELTAVALKELALLARTETRRQILELGIGEAVEKLAFRADSFAALEPNVRRGWPATRPGRCACCLGRKRRRHRTTRTGRGGVSGGPQGLCPGSRAVGLGYHAEQPGQRPSRSRGT